MPTVSFSITDLWSILGRRVSLEYIRELLDRSKCEFEDYQEGTITVEVTSDRPDMFSVEGIARALKGLMDLEVGIPEYRIEKSSRKIISYPSVKDVRPSIAGFIVRNLNLDEDGVAHLMQFQEKLHLTLCRDRRKASIGIYDLSKIEGDIKYMALPPREIKFIPLGEDKEMSGTEILNKTDKGKIYGKYLRGFKLAPILIDSKNTVLSMPPIINSEDTKVTEETHDIFIDVTGFDDKFVSTVASLIALNLAERGGSIELVEVIKWDNSKFSPDLKPVEMTLDVEYANSIIGLKLNAESMSKLLKRMRFDSTILNDKRLLVRIPPYRIDILHPVDLVEDIAIAYGYNNITPSLPNLITRGGELPIRWIERALRELMVGLGFQEVMNYAMSNPEVQIYKMKLPEHYKKYMVEIENPVSGEYSGLRIWLLPGLLNFLSYNLKVAYPQKIFEVGYCIKRDKKFETLTKQELKLAAAITDYSTSFEDIQAPLYSILNVFNLRVKFMPISHPSFIEGRSASVSINNVEIGIIGEVSPEVLINFKLKTPVSAFEISIDSLFELTRVKGK